MRKTVKTKVIYDSSKVEPAGSHYGTRGSLRGSGRIRKRIILGDKFDYGEKAKEKKNYVLYVSGQGQEKKEIEEMEQLAGKTKKNEKIVEEKEIIDNYQYHETKDIKKKHRKDTLTHHERLCSPFERTKIKKYTSYTSEPLQSGYKIIKTTDLVNKKDYSRNYKPYKPLKNERSYNSKTQNHRKTKIEDSKVYETYKPPSKINNTTISTNSISRPKRAISFGENIIINNSYQNKPKINGHKNITHIEYNYQKPKQIFSPQQVVNYEYKEENNNQPSYGNVNSNYTIDAKKTISTQHKTNSFSSVNSQKNYEIPVNTNRIKFGSQSKPEKLLTEGPKYHYKAAERPKSGNIIRKRSVQRKVMKREKEIVKRINNSNGFIPFGGHGTKVGQGNLSKIPKPLSNPNIESKQIVKKVKKVSNVEEKINGIVTQQYERNVSYTNLGQTTENSNKNNIVGFKDFIPEKNNFAIDSKIPIFEKINNDSIKFPGIGVKVGGTSKISKLIEFNNNENKENMDLNMGMGISFSEYRNYEQNYIKTDNNEKCNEESLFYRGENEGMFEEIFCPIHGKKIVRLNNFQI